MKAYAQTSLNGFFTLLLFLFIIKSYQYPEKEGLVVSIVSLQGLEVL